jgi:hypothetical protein
MRTVLLSVVASLGFYLVTPATVQKKPAMIGLVHMMWLWARLFRCLTKGISGDQREGYLQRHQTGSSSPIAAS